MATIKHKRFEVIKLPNVQTNSYNVFFRKSVWKLCMLLFLLGTLFLFLGITIGHLTSVSENHLSIFEESTSSDLSGMNAEVLAYGQEIFHEFYNKIKSILDYDSRSRRSIEMENDARNSPFFHMLKDKLATNQCDATLKRVEGSDSKIKPNRKKRDIKGTIDPLQKPEFQDAVQYLRNKREAEDERSILENIYNNRCKKSLDDEGCRDIRKEIRKLTDVISENLEKLTKILGSSTNDKNQKDFSIENKYSSEEKDESKTKDVTKATGVYGTSTTTNSELDITITTEKNYIPEKKILITSQPSNTQDKTTSFEHIDKIEPTKGPYIHLVTEKPDETDIQTTISTNEDDLKLITSKDSKNAVSEKPIKISDLSSDTTKYFDNNNKFSPDEATIVPKISLDEDLPVTKPTIWNDMSLFTEESHKSTESVKFQTEFSIFPHVSTKSSDTTSASHQDIETIYSSKTTSKIFKKSDTTSESPQDSKATYYSETTPTTLAKSDITSESSQDSETIYSGKITPTTSPKSDITSENPDNMIIYKATESIENKMTARVTTEKSAEKSISNNRNERIDTPESIENQIDDDIKENSKSSVPTESQPRFDYKMHPKVHEDLVDNFDSVAQHLDENGASMPLTLQWGQKLKNNENIVNPELIDDYNTPGVPGRAKSKVSANSAKNKEDSVSGSFMSLCEQLLRQNSPSLKTRVTAPPPANDFTINNQNHFTGRGPTAVTGESMKASAQVMFNPGFGYMPSPMCFFGSPPNINDGNIGGVNNNGNQQFWPPIPFPNSNFGPYGMNQGGFMYVPPNFNPGNNFGAFGHTGPVTGIVNHVTHQATQNFPAGTLPYYCTYMPTNGQQFGQPVFRSSVEDDNEQKNNSSNIPTETDIVYATYANHMAAYNVTGRAHRTCPFGLVPCFGTHQCLSQEKWCDNTVDCLDSSDETACTCRSRISKTKICDGYPDCPMGEDELGCFGCGKLTFSCYNNVEEYINERNSSVSMCYSALEKCDGFENCLNGNDEKDCSIIVAALGHHTSYMVSHSEGVLHHNYKGKWYPVCENPQKWAREACQSEIGILDQEPELTYQPSTISGPFIQLHSPELSHLADLGDPIFSDTCPRMQTQTGLGSNQIVHVKCPPMKCGIIKSMDYVTSMLRIRKSRSEEEESSTRNKRTDSRVVGGTPSDPLSWPFIAALYRNGNFHCGSIIFNENWAITAAHCVFKYQFNYYELRVGMLRRYSFAPMTQTLRVSHIVVHERYDRAHMINDLALIRTEQPILYNRYVRPICLPAVGRSSMDNDWARGPAAGTICTAVGWGALREKGPDPDNLREVQIPILPVCKHQIDQAGDEICAGEPGGGRDACQGDSGGPLFCMSVSNPKEWYLAGIISHGEGCARPDEPGVYTRVALYLDWLRECTQSGNLPSVVPKQTCPGHVCVWGGTKCIPASQRCNDIVDCLGGEDEVGCVFSYGANVGKTHDKNELTSETTTAAPFITTDLGFDLTTPLTTIKEESTNKASVTTRDVPTKPVYESMPRTITKKKKPPSQDEEKADPKPHFNTTPVKENRFLCSKIHQTIDIRYRCNRIIDCEDGTDEEGCTCRDYLKAGSAKMDVHFDKVNAGQLSDLICNGNVDCADMSDEQNCDNCTTEQFFCPISRKCIPKKAKCDGSIDCSFKEDELDCVALTNGQNVYIDGKYRPSLQSVGFFSKNTNGKWKIVCTNHEDFQVYGGETAGQICTLLGFNGYKFYNFTSLSEVQLAPIEASFEKIMLRSSKGVINKHLMTHYDYTSSEDNPEVQSTKNFQLTNHILAEPRTAIAKEKIEPTNKTCQALYVECVPHYHSSYEPSKQSVVNISHTTTKIPIQPLQPVVQPEKIPNVVVLDKKKTSVIAVNATTKPVVEIHNHYHWPWSVDIFVNGVLRCNGVLLDRRWILVQGKCLEGLRVEYDYIAALFGRSLIQIHRQQHLNEQHQRINCIRAIPESNLFLLQVEYPVRYSRYVLPTFLPQSISGNDGKAPTNGNQHGLNATKAAEECMTVWHDGFGQTRSFYIREIFDDEYCRETGYSCYQRANITSKNKDLHHEQQNSLNPNATQSGVIVCRNNETAWYPMAFYTTLHHNCHFDKPVPIGKFDKFSAAIQQVIDTSECNEIYPAPICPTLRCPLGNCLLLEEICNGKVNCYDGIDENTELCHLERRDCLPSELKCNNGNCVSKTKFCDHYNDCGDLTDEPSQCSCYTFMKTTNPNRICDGIRNCYDKSDENPIICNCTESTFRCGSSNQCVPRDFVCDKVRDCPEGEDEAYCYGVEQPANNNNISTDGFAQVIKQSYGVWHTMCFERENTLNITEISKICNTIGYKNVTTPLYRFLDTNENMMLLRSDGNDTRSAETNSDFEMKYREPTKAVVVNKFSPLRLNKEFTFYVKPSRPIAEITNWDDKDYGKCHRLEIKC